MKLLKRLDLNASSVAEKREKVKMKLRLCPKKYTL